MMRSVFIGYDPREAEAFAVCRHSIRRHSYGLPIKALELGELRDQGLYWRPMSRRNGKLWDDISEAPCATEFAISRFLTKELAGSGWALFIDCDMLARTDLNDLFNLADPKCAVMCVQHPNYIPPEAVKMDGQEQTRYARKNWSSAMLFNCNHPSNKALTVDLINTVPGRDLHRFCWLKDDEIGDLPMSWNWLVGTSDQEINPDLVHFTAGGPWFAGYEDVPYAAEWRAERAGWLASRTHARTKQIANGLHAGA